MIPFWKATSTTERRHEARDIVIVPFPFQDRQRRILQVIGQLSGPLQEKLNHALKSALGLP